MTDRHLTWIELDRLLVAVEGVLELVVDLVELAEVRPRGTVLRVQLDGTHEGLEE